ncbi:Carbonic anhydrase, gamma class [Candidatus Burkholderia humilis]|nr:Carbonic anhydrase, gamma class [Candidatus Burkholderia humilis]
MVYDFGLLKIDIRDLIDGFDHAAVLWSGDDPDYLAAMRWTLEARSVFAMMPRTFAWAASAWRGFLFRRRSSAAGMTRPHGAAHVWRASCQLSARGIMIRKNPRGDLSVIHPEAFVDPAAILCRHAIVEEDVFIGPYAVIRADEQNANGQIAPIRIGAHSNIQDGVVTHTKSGARVTIGERTSIAHRAIVHGPCSVRHNMFIDFNSVLPTQLCDRRRFHRTLQRRR